MRRSFVLSTFLLLPACHSPTDGANSTVPSQCQTNAPIVGPQKTDLLFVIDDSGSMADKQAEVAAELPAFIAALQNGAGVAQDFQVGVITTSVYQNAYLSGNFYYQNYPEESGHLRTVPIVAPDGTVAPGTEKVLSSSDPALVDKFSRLVRQGVSGSGQETPFEAARLALSPPLSTTPLSQGGNQGFLRDRARLLVVIVSDDDDCSEIDRPVQVWVNDDRSRDTCTEQAAKLTPVETYYTLFQSLTDSTGAPREVVWASIAPVARSTKLAVPVLENGVLHCQDCPNAEGTGLRHRQMATLFDPSLNDLYSVCNPSYHDYLLGVAGQAVTGQVIDVNGVPDPGLLKVAITRQSGTVQACTLGNGGFVYRPPAGLFPSRIEFQGSCLRQPTDQKLQLQLLCAG